MNFARGWMKKNSKWIMLIAGMTIVLMGYMSWGLLTISYKAPVMHTIGVLFTYMTAVIYIIFILFVRKSQKYEEDRQLWVLSGVGFVISVLLLVRNISNWILICAWILAFGITYISGVFGRKECVALFSRGKYSKNLYEIIVLLLLTSVLLYDRDAMQFKWDGLLYFITCNDLDIGSLSDLAIYGHIAQTYGMFIGIANILFGNTAIAMSGLNIVLLLGSVCGFYAVVRELAPNKKESQYVIVTAVYAWSPFLLGMVHYHNLDFYCYCLFPVVLCFLYKKQWIFFCVFSLLFCFTKEPAIVIYGAMCVGVVLSDYINDTGFSGVERLKRLFDRPQYYLMIFPGVLWLATYKLLGPWSAGNGGFSIDLTYVAEKCKNLYVLNFNWIFSLFAISGIVWTIYKKNRELLTVLLPVLCSQLAFTVFSCLFKTVNHARYNDTNQVTLYLLAIVSWLYYQRKEICQIINGLVAIALLISCFYTIDPITKICYPNYDIGDTKMIYTSNTPLGDSMIYNRQMLGFEGVLSMALQDALCEGSVVLFPTIENNAYSFDGMASVGIIEDSIQVEYEYWNPEKQRREALESNGTQEFKVIQLTDHINWAALQETFDGKVNYIYLPAVDRSIAQEIKTRYSILEEEEYRYKGWKINRICFENHKEDE